MRDWAGLVRLGLTDLLGGVDYQKGQGRARGINIHDPKGSYSLAGQISICPAKQ